MAKITVQIAEFQPVKDRFLIYDENGQLLPGSEDVWLTLIPPTFHEDRQRGDLLRFSYGPSGTVSVTNPRMREAKEIWLTFGGTNLEVELPRLDEQGNVMFKKTDDGITIPIMETISFPEDGKASITEAEFMAKLDRLPDYIVTSWHNLVIQRVAKGWAFPF